MKTKKDSLNQMINIKISKSGLKENDKRLLINKLGLNNLSQVNLFEEKEKLNNFDKNSTTQITTLNNERTDNKNSNKSSILIKIKKHYTPIVPKKYITTKQSLKNNKSIKSINNISTFSSNEIVNDFHNYRKFSNQKKFQ